MSCYQVSPRHLAALVGIAQATGTQIHGAAATYYGGAVALFEILAQANADSVAARYNETTEPVPVPEDFAASAMPVRTLADIAAAIKLIDCYEYQSCEAPDFEKSAVAIWCRHARRELTHRIPGFAAAYSTADWSV